MSVTDSVFRAIDDAMISSRDRRDGGRIDGRVKRCDVDEESEFESDTDLCFERTLRSSRGDTTVRDLFERLPDEASGPTIEIDSE